MKFGISIALFFSVSCVVLSAADPDFSDVIRPILSENCFHCHGPDKNDRKAGLRLDTADGAKEILGNGASSELLERIFHHDPDEVMPPPKSKLTLTDLEKKTLKAWISSGAKYEEHWSFVKPVRPAVPRGIDGIKNPIDAFIGKKLKDEGLSFSPEAAPHRLIRRVTLDLTGLPPTIEEVDAFLVGYQRDGDRAYEQLVDRLVASPRYGETMALPWLDAARFADTDGYQFDGPRFMWRWRDWVIDAYHSGMPFDQFTIEQLAGDLLPEPTLDQQIATGFNRNHRYNSEAGLVVKEYLLENAVDRVDTTATLWMGLTMGCARCHDHKYDPISQKDYYQLIAFFNSVPEAGRAVKAGNSEPVILAPTREQQPVLAARQEALARAKADLKPGPDERDGGLLIDRKLRHHYALDQIPAKSGKATGEVRFAEKAMVFDGESEVAISGIDKKLTFRANQEFTISFWLKPGSIRDSIILSRQKPGTTRPGVELALVEGGRLRFDLISRWLAGAGRVVTMQALAEDQWVHIMVSNDGSQSANGQLIYIDGQKAELTASHNTNSNVGGVGDKPPLVLGGGIRPKSNRLIGAIRDLRLYQTDLWPEEAEILAAKQGGPERLLFSRIKTTEQYRTYVKAREDLEAFQKTLPTVMVMRDSPTPKPTFIRTRGVYNELGDRVGRDVPEIFPSLQDDLPKNRLGLARWLLSDEHPLTARVAVNRYWQKYFGTGIVKTSEDFGVQGEIPSHSELLDWLAVEFRESGWDIGAMQKLIVTSRTYRQSARLRSDLQERDPGNRLLARGPRMRLSGHAIRDQALFVSGLLKERIGGPSVSPYQPANLWAEMSMGMEYRQSKGDDLYRRSLYTIWKRTVAPPTMALFDSADREACWVKRKETNTPLQALTLLNETGYVESARHLAVRMLEEGKDDPVGYGFRMVTAREMSEREGAIFQVALKRYLDEFSADVNAAKKLITTGASPMNQSIPPEKIAAYTAIANILLNLDEVITRQ